MVNFSLNASSLAGIVLAVAGAGLYLLRSLRPKLARDYDIFFSAVALLCGGILFFQGWRQDPILQFGQFLLTGSAIFFAFESIRLREVATEQAKRNTPIVDDDRPVSRVYRAELDDLSFDDRPTSTRRIRASRDPRNRDDYDDETSRRRPSSGRSDLERPDRTPDRSRRRRPRVDESPVTDRPDSYDAGFDSDDLRSRGRNEPPSRPSESRPRRPRPADDVSRPRPDSDYSPPPSEYVDYKPIEPDDEDSNW